MTLLICASRADPATEITYNFSQRVLVYAEGKDISIVYLGDSDANPNKVRSMLKMKPSAFFFYDHGSEDALYGEADNEIVPVVRFDEANLLSGMVVDALACLSAQALGPEAVNKGCRAYLGYDEVTYVVDDEETERVMNTSKRSLLDGHIASEAYEAQRDAYEEPSGCLVAKLVKALFGKRVLGMLRKTRNALTGRAPNLLIWEFYSWNRAHFVLLGDGNANIYEV